MSRILEALAKLASDLDGIEAIEYADQVDNISSIMTGADVASGQHMPAGDSQWSLPSVGVNMSKDAMGLTDVPIGDAPYANREGIPEDDMDTQLFSGDEEGVDRHQHLFARHAWRRGRRRRVAAGAPDRSELHQRG